MAASCDLTVVVATHDRAERLGRLLDALRRQTLARDRFEVIVVDDGSRDGTPGVLGRAVAAGDLRLRALRVDPAQGPGVARNAGWRAAGGAAIAFTDDDCVPAPEWLEALLAAWAGDPGRFVQGPTAPDPDERDALGPFSRTMRVGALGPNFQTCNVLYPRAMLERHGGFDVTAFRVVGVEDADLAWRCMAGGATPVWAPRAQVFHAVHRLGPVGKLRIAWRWHEAPHLYVRHPGMRRHLTYRLFWKKSHYLLVRAALGLLAPRALRFWFIGPLAPSYLRRARDEGGPVWTAPYFVVHDAVEMAAMVRGAIRYRTPLL